MAAGDIIWFDQALVDEAEALHDMELGTYKLALLTSAVTPAASDADPRFGAGGTTNYATNEVTPGGNYTDDGNSFANPVVTLTGGLAQFDADDFSIAQHASNPTNARWALVYNTAAGLRALFAVDLGSALDLTTGAFSIAWNASGIMRKNQA